MKYLVNHPELKFRRSSLRKNQTDAERLLWSKARGKQLNGVKFFRQFSIGPYVVDFYSPKLRLAVEVDGGQHNEVDIRQQDLQRTKYLRDQDVRIIRFWNNDVLTNMEGVIETIAAQIRNSS